MKIHIYTVLAGACPFLTICSAQQQSPACDRLCLESILSTYLTALSAHDTSKLPTTSGVKYVENSQIVPLGTGEWKIAGALGKYRHVFADPESQQVAAITTLKENDAGVIYVVRLKIEDGAKISEIETQITRDATGFALYENMTEPEEVWLQSVPVEDRLSRQELITQSDKYYSGMERNDPKGDYSFFDKDCNRLEDARNTTNQKGKTPYGHSNDTTFTSLGCEAQFQTGFLGFVTLIRNRRYPVVDEERQAVFAITIFDHNGTVRTLPGINGTSSPIPPYFDVPRTLAASEAFRLRHEKIFRIEMTLAEVPYGIRSAFEPSPPARGTGNSLTVRDPCDDYCLRILVERVLQALVRVPDTPPLPLAQGVRYSENGQFIAIGDGLWGTMQGFTVPEVDDYASWFFDLANSTVGYWGRITEQSTPGLLAMRIKVEKGQITEIEATVVRAEYAGLQGGTKTMLRPPLPVEWEGASLGKLDAAFVRSSSVSEGVPSGLVSAYFDGLQAHSSVNVPLAPSCSRRDNNRQITLSCAAQMMGDGEYPNGLPEYISEIRDRRILATESTDRGIVLAVAMVDYPATTPGPLGAAEAVPSTYLISQLIKATNGSITKVESMIKWVPLGYTSAWSEL